MSNETSGKNVVIISFEDYNKDPRVQKQISSLLKDNYNIYIYIRRYYTDNSESLPIFFTNTNIQVNLKNISNIKFPIINIILQLLQNIKVGFEIRRLKNINIIQANNPRAWFAGYIAKKKHTKLVFDSYELVPENVSGIRKLFWGSLVKLLIKTPDYIIHAEINRAIYFKHKYKISNVLVIENYPYKNNFNMVHNISKENKIRLIYSGSILKNRGYEDLIYAFKDISENIILDFWGTGPVEYVNSLKNTVNTLNIKNIRFKGGYKINDLYEILTDYDVGLVFYKSSNLNQYFCAPNKLYEYMQMEIPIITFKTPSISPLIESNKIGKCINDITSEELEFAIEEIVCNKYKNNYSTNLKFNYTWESIESKYLNIYKSLI